MVCQPKRHQHLLEEEVFPTSCGLTFDFINLLLATIGFVSLIVGVTGSQVRGPTLKNEHELNKNITAICCAFVASLLIGCAAGLTKTLCSMKDFRKMTYQWNYNYLKVVFWTLLTIQVLAPAFAYPAMAKDAE